MQPKKRVKRLAPPEKVRPDSSREYKPVLQRTPKLKKDRFKEDKVTTITNQFFAMPENTQKRLAADLKAIVEKKSGYHSQNE